MEYTRLGGVSGASKKDVCLAAFSARLSLQNSKELSNETAKLALMHIEKNPILFYGTNKTLLIIVLSNLAREMACLSMGKISAQDREKLCHIGALVEEGAREILFPE